MTHHDYNDYSAEVIWHVWNSGGSPDKIDDDRVLNNFNDGKDEEHAARVELDSQKLQQKTMLSFGSDLAP